MKQNLVDYYQLDELLSGEHLLVRDSIRNLASVAFGEGIDRWAQGHEGIPDLMPKLGDMGVLGSFIPQQYGGGGMDQISYGIMMQELEAVDSSIRSAASVQSSLVMFPIYEYGSEQQKNDLLPSLAAGELIGAFGLTEPNHGSNPSGMETVLKKYKDGYLLTGAKMWITNASVCDIAVVWAKDEERQTRGVILRKGMPGFAVEETMNKWSLRASKTGSLYFDEVYVREEDLLPHIKSMRGPLSCLNSARYGISWGVIGAAIDCYNVAVQYSLEREQFGKPIASFQLQQKKLAEMLTEITKAQLLSWRLGVLKNENRATPQQISMAKRNNVQMALQVARESRQVLGAMGIVGEYPIMRHMMNLESVITYEGTHDIHLLITGQDITGMSAF